MRTLQATEPESLKFVKKWKGTEKEIFSRVINSMQFQKEWLERRK
jgi:hypothetical protein